MDASQVFFPVAHDATRLNRQGPARGTWYPHAMVTLVVPLKATATSALVWRHESIRRT
jgi:hypothetical protein